MTNLSSDDFSAPSRNRNFIVSGSLQMIQKGFHPRYNWREDNKREHPEKACAEDETEQLDDGLNQEIAEAYAQGYLNGQQAVMVHQDQIDREESALAAALNRLKIGDQAKLAKLLWKVLLSLFEQSVGHVAADPELMRRRCDAAVALLRDGIGQACLHVAATDADILRDYNCDIPIKVDPSLLPGSVRLTHEAGQIISGTIAITKEIESRIGSAGSEPC
ncbi:hypothetical protein [Parasphingorhabdus cellanae]|uniref:Flagellar assembly protein FliH/Type III secretion system HrpE domain-containing protein n=1 Tax=Parasphingorhabdus cellanae TaxID=2806553 RepID=A0ABX7T6L1_9SPHN|nr:hypothetical protein [Parasphingorhabdus cellanae]QTD56480.1 hypothetical protein J4G78_02470 [Parasphingorhabdus cellanae]